ncbi:MAG: GTP cyclohydrolase II [Pseudomonadota bacterium]
MAFAPTPDELIARARADLRMGLPVVIDGQLVFAVETLSPARFAAAMALPTRPVLAITDWRARTLKARAYDGDIARIAVPDGAGLPWACAVADPKDDLTAVMKGPFRTLREGDAAAARSGIALAKAAQLLPAVLTAPADGPAGLAALTRLSVEEIAASPLSEVVAARLPMALAGEGRLHVFRPEDGGEEHYAVEIGQPDRARPVLARLHSACFTGDVLGSLKCDCGPQLHGALAQMGAEGAGVLLYLQQEGRGIGLANKMRAYALQDQGFDTVEANHRLGFEDDERNFTLGADLLRKLGFGAVRLMTNNPAKVARMEEQGLEVTERVPLKVGRNPFNEGYLATKAEKSGHFL